MFPKPDDFFKKSFEEWEKQTADYWTAMMRDPAFLKTAWQGMEMALQGRQAVQAQTQKNLEQWQWPTREKQERILHQINRLQILVDDLEERVEDLMAQVKQ